MIGRGEGLGAFAVRSTGEVRANINRRAQVPVDLDGQPGKFFDGAGLVLISSTHGAISLKD
ncbi:MAG: hypothetical protein IT515_10580 [Burkholderiales bacterium]|nr:hypothetical protein [Burkholderiales bacterium]